MRMKVQSCVKRGGRWDVRIRLPDYDWQQPNNDIAVGSWSSTVEGHGLFLSVGNAGELLAIARLLEIAAEAIATQGAKD